MDAWLFRPTAWLTGYEKIPLTGAFGSLQATRVRNVTRFGLLLISFIGLPAMAASTNGPDALDLWNRGALRGANVMQAQCTVEDLRVLRSWGANLAEIPVSDVYAPTPPYAFQPENLAKLDRAVKAAEQ